MKEQSPRQQLAAYVGRGELRGVFEKNPNGLSNEALDLLIRIALNYCEPKRKRRKKNIKL